MHKGHTGLRHTGLRYTGLRHTGLRHTGLRHTGLRHTGLRHTGLRHTGLRHTGLRHTGLRHTGLRHTGLRHELYLCTCTFHTNTIIHVQYNTTRTHARTHITAIIQLAHVHKLINEMIGQYLISPHTHLVVLCPTCINMLYPPLLQLFSTWVMCEILVTCVNYIHKQELWIPLLLR